MNSISNNKRMIDLWSKSNTDNPCDLSVWSKKKFSWTCNNGHTWNASAERIYCGGGCPFCYGRYATPDNNIATKHPNLLSEWDYSKNNICPTKICPRSGKKFFWKCTNGHSWRAKPHLRALGQQCPYCTNHSTDESNSLFSNKEFSYLLTEWDYNLNVISPKDIVPGSSKKVWWKCHNSHCWEASIKQRTKIKTGCPFCNQIQLNDGQCFPSYTEAYFYLTLKMESILFIRNKKYPNSKLISDFYIPETKTFIEITGYNSKKSLNNNPLNYFKYLRKIVRKKQICEENGFSFLFIQKTLSSSEKELVIKNLKT